MRLFSLQHEISSMKTKNNLPPKYKMRGVYLHITYVPSWHTRQQQKKYLFNGVEHKALPILFADDTSILLTSPNNTQMQSDFNIIF